MTEYDATKAGCARYLAHEAELAGYIQQAEYWRRESWRLWDGRSSLKFDRSGDTYYNNSAQYAGMLTDTENSYCDCAVCEFDDPDADLGYMLYCDPDYLHKRQKVNTAE